MTGDSAHTDVDRDAGNQWPWLGRPRRMAFAVVEDLVDRIVGGQFQAGDPLPNELALCANYGASRTVIREALQSAETMHLVRAQQGQGTIVRPLEDWDLLSPLVLAATVRHDAELAILEDLIDMRRALEAQMAAQAAVRATDQQLADISACYDRLVEDADNPARHLQTDLEFHDAIMRASGNRLGRAATLVILAEGFRSLRYLGDSTPERGHVANVGHRQIRDRILAHDAEGAAVCMNEHIVGSWLRRRPRPPSDRPSDALRGSPGVGSLTERL
jgi:GntR family transcriptional regulator, galactonate operon transcriptional repressor